MTNLSEFFKIVVDKILFCAIIVNMGGVKSVIKNSSPGGTPTANE